MNSHCVKLPLSNYHYLILLCDCSHAEQPSKRYYYFYLLNVAVRRESLFWLVFFPYRTHFKPDWLAKFSAHLMINRIFPTLPKQRKIHWVVKFQVSCLIVAETLWSYTNFKFSQSFWLQASFLQVVIRFGVYVVFKIMGQLQSFIHIKLLFF